jgi:ABC-type antimicrobial peptide transport system, permease component
MLKDNKFISAISIAGTSLAIMMIMVIFVAAEIKTVDAAPEVNRSRTMYVFRETQVKNADDPKNRTTNMGNIGYDAVKYLLNMKTPEYVSVMHFVQRGYWGVFEIHTEGSNDYFQALTKPVDSNYWKIMSFTFTEGRPFTEEEFESGVKVALIKQSLAKEMFKGEQTLGKYIELNFEKYRIIGVIKDVSQIFREAEGDIWIPYKSVTGWENYAFEVMLVAKNKADFDAIRDEVKECEKRFDADNDPWKIFIPGPLTIKESEGGYMLGGRNEEEVNAQLQAKNRKIVVTFIILLLIPSLNLSGFSMSRIKKRVTEIGIRKAFGAKRSVILIQVLYENLITSLIGGFIGFVLSIITIIWLKSWLLGVSTDTDIPVSTYLSWQSALAVTIVCIVLNLLSAGIPAYRASKMKIVDSLTQKR